MKKESEGMKVMKIVQQGQVGGRKNERAEKSKWCDRENWLEIK
jgi:hypothetical protein